jgi:hypothetical protein
LGVTIRSLENDIEYLDGGQTCRFNTGLHRVMELLPRGISPVVQKSAGSGY